jgi:hypothetical protein
MTRLFALALAVFLAVSTDVTVAQDAPENISSEQKVLAMRIGTWDVVSHQKPAQWTPDGGTKKSVETIGWALKGKFIQGTATNKTDGVESMWMMNYDENIRAYRFWFFSSSGAFPLGNSIGHWNAETKTTTTKGNIGDNITITSSMRFVSRDLQEFSFLIKNDDGDVLMDVTGTSKRKKEK